MISKAATPDEYFAALPPGRKEILTRLRQVLQEHIPAGFREEMNYGMPGFVVPHSLYPSGYHANPELPLPFISIASQKNYVSFYHMGLYDPELLEWLTTRWIETTGKKPDMGKGCIRFKKTTEIPYELLGELAAKITPETWIKQYEKEVKK
ncbi:DUF1801 domain-containing protein [Chitinophaga sp. CC14]|uniref:DUF1801 domain-containing protein n=1 Tax=Chitinophaga sp. CC14 TaxID=3029199 RepID=UPI003B7A330C